MSSQPPGLSWLQRAVVGLASAFELTWLIDEYARDRRPAISPATAGTGGAFLIALCVRKKEYASVHYLLR
jgi:hypothetical protein